MIEQVLLWLLAFFFILNAINHFYNSKILEEYARKRHLFKPKLSVKLAGVLLLFGGIALLIPSIRIYGVLSLGLFLVVASFTIHQFWKAEGHEEKMLELMHFAKNFAILTELIYLGLKGS